MIDEAHKAKGDYHFTVAVRLLAAESRYFRVLALSASPGNSLPSVQQVRFVLFCLFLLVLLFDCRCSRPYYKGDFKPADFLS